MTLKVQLPKKEPYALVVGTYQDPQQTFLIVDSNITTEIDFRDIPLILMCAFFVFNIHYTKGCNNVYLFFEHSLLNIKKKQFPPSVAHFLASLHSNE